MEKLQRRSDGFAETLSGKYAISPTRFSGKDSDHKWFDYRRTVTAPITRVRWRIDDKIAIIDASVAVYMISKGYAANVSEKQIADWNASVEELELDAPSPQPVAVDEANLDVITEQPETTEQPTEGQPGGEATNTAEGEQNAPEGQEGQKEGTSETNGDAGGEQGGGETNNEEGGTSEESSKAKNKAKGKSTEPKGLL